MSSIRSAKTGFERTIVRELRRQGLRFKTNYSRAMGKPDIALPRRRKAVFLHSAFWHGWRLPAWEHILPSEFWIEKLRKNRARDKRVVRALRREGWAVLIVREHQIERDFAGTLDRIAVFLRAQ